MDDKEEFKNSGVWKEPKPSEVQRRRAECTGTEILCKVTLELRIWSGSIPAVAKKSRQLRR